MPIYEYECEQCSVRFERLQRMADAALTDCPECSGHVHRVMQPVGIIFKGSGFYVTDNKSRSSTGVPKKKDEEAKPAATSESSATTPAASNVATPATSSAKEGESG
jgi:putative FmdB family regulatory protein